MYKSAEREPVFERRICGQFGFSQAGAQKVNERNKEQRSVTVCVSHNSRCVPVRPGEEVNAQENDEVEKMKMRRKVKKHRNRKL